jgi:hypothetical protein
MGDVRNKVDFSPTPPLVPSSSFPGSEACHARGVMSPRPALLPYPALKLLNFHTTLFFSAALCVKTFEPQDRFVWVNSIHPHLGPPPPQREEGFGRELY